MILFFVTDIHGSELCFRKFLNAARFYDADVLVLGGDITGKHVVPYWPVNGTYLVGADEGTLEVPPAGLDELLQAVRDRGGYPVRSSAEEFEALVSDDQRLEELIGRLMQESIARWLSMADERLGGSGVRCFISPGNDDPPEIDRLLDEAATVENPEGKLVELDDRFSMITCGITNPTPWHSPREEAERELEARLEELARQVAEPERAVFNLHAPPRDTPLDFAPLLDETKKPVVRGGQIEMTHVGSTAVRHVIERHRPLLGLHGHVHESRGLWRFGRTLCLNPGSEYPEGILRGARVELNERKGVRAYQLTQG